MPPFAVCGLIGVRHTGSIAIVRRQGGAGHEPFAFRARETKPISGPEVRPAVRVGVVGVGSMGQNHARVYSEIAELVGVVDVDPAVGKTVAERTRTAYVPSVKDLVKAGAEAVSVAVPTNLHAKVAIELIDAG